MNIGLTYDLRAEYLRLGFGEDDVAEFDSPVTVEAIERTLIALGHQTERIGHVLQLVNALSAGRRWDLIFNICEGLTGFGREAQVPAVLEAFGLPYTFSDPLIMSLTLHKGYTKRVIRDMGLPTPDFVVIEHDEQIAAMDLPFPLFGKPVAEGTGKGVTQASRIRDREQLGRVCRRLLTEYRQPVLVESYLPGREFTVGLTGTGLEAEVIGVVEVVLKDGAETDVYSYQNKETCEQVVDYRLVDDDQARAAAEVALAVWRGLGCRDAGRVDLRADADGRPNFLEVNPLAGLHPSHSDLPIICTQVGLTYQDLIERIVSSAMKRKPDSLPGPFLESAFRPVPAMAG